MEPAHETKHVPSLVYDAIVLSQRNDGESTGTALWLAGQILSFYLQCHLKPRRARPRAVELGSGVGLTALVLSTLGYDVLATDTPHVCNSVLRYNIAANLPHLPNAGRIQVRELDWNVDPELWTWNDPMRITPAGSASVESRAEGLLGPPFDLIISSDTIYDASLVHPFFRTVRALAAYSRGIDPPLFLLAIERRDRALIEAALASSPVPLTRVRTRKILKAMAQAGVRWDASDWDGVEIWKGSLQL